MLRIGEFSQLSQVTVKTLHHYDQIGLLSPAYIDESNSYRYYTLEQLPRIHRIMALKELGLSLEQIEMTLEDEVSNENIRAMLALKQAEIRQQVQEAQRQLALVEFRLRMIDAETAFPNLDVVVKPLKPMRFLSLIVDIQSRDKGGKHYMKTLVANFYHAIEDGHIRFTGISYDVFHGEEIMPLDSPQLHNGQHEILLGVDEKQSDISLEGIGQLTIKEQPPIAAAATLVLTGDGPARQAIVEQLTLLRRWAFAQGHKPDKLVRYLHHRGPMQTLNKDEFVIEAQLPLNVTL